MSYLIRFNENLLTLKRYCKNKSIHEQVVQTGIIKQYEIVFDLSIKVMREWLINRGEVSANDATSEYILILSYRRLFFDLGVWDDMLKTRISVIELNSVNRKLVSDNIIRYLKIFDNLIKEIEEIESDKTIL